MEIAGCPSCPPQGVLVVGFHHPDRRAWNRELLGLVPGGREVHPTGAAAIPEGGWLFSSVKGTPILGSHEGLGGGKEEGTCHPRKYGPALTDDFWALTHTA